MPIVVRVLGVHRGGGAAVVAIEFGDGQCVTLDASGEAGVEAVSVGEEVSLALVPLVPVDHPDARLECAPVNGQVPADHPFVLEPTDAARCEAALPAGDAFESGASDD
jgi:hypothetical protein